MIANADMNLKSVSLFASLSASQLAWLERHVQLQEFAPGQTVVTEGEMGQDRLFVVLRGEASLCKQVAARNGSAAHFLEIDVRGPGGFFGEMPLLDGQPVSVTVHAKTALSVVIADLRKDKSQARSVRNTIISELQRRAVSRLRMSFDEKAENLRSELERQTYRGAVGSMLVTALCLLSFYTLALGFIPKFESYLMVNFAASPFIIVFFALMFLPVMIRSGFPLAFFGMRTDNAQPALLFALTASGTFILAGVLVKWALVHSVPALYGLPVISFADVRIGGQHVMSSPWYWLAVSIYLVLTPVQEFVARCGIQAPLYAFMQGSELHRRAFSIVVSNLVFSAAHAHISFQFALAAFIPGIFWGWIFARTNSLLAASASHLVIGGAGIFLFGIEELVAKLN